MSTTTELYRKKSDRTRNFSVAGAITAAGAVFLYFDGPGPAVVVLAAGLMLLLAAFVRSQRAIVTIDNRNVLLRFTEPITVPFKSIARADHLKNHDIELCLHSGVKVLVRMDLLEHEDSVWLRKALRKEIRVANA